MAAVGEEGEVFDNRAWGNQIPSPPAPRGEMSQRDRGGLPLPRGQHRAPLCLRHLPPRSGGRGDRGGIFTRRVAGEGSGAADRRIRSATPCGRPGREGIRAASSPAGGGSPPLSLRDISPRSAGGEGIEAVRRARLAGLGASPSVAARQLPLGGSDWIGLFGGCFVGDAEAGPALALVGAEAAVVVGGERVSTWRRLFLRSGR